MLTCTHRANAPVTGPTWLPSRSTVARSGHKENSTDERPPRPGRRNESTVCLRQSDPIAVNCCPFTGASESAFAASARWFSATLLGEEGARVPGGPPSASTESGVHVSNCWSTGAGYSRGSPHLSPTLLASFRRETLRRP